jgi:hypothetical protein
MARWHEEQRKLDMTDLKRAVTQALLKQVGVGILYNAPSAPLCNKPRRDEIHNVPAMYDSLPERFKSPLASGVMMLIEPREVLGIF